MKLSTFYKAIAPALLGVIGVVIAWVATGEFDALELRITGAALVTAIAVYVIPNVASVPWLKALVPSLLGVVAVGTSALETGVFSEGALRAAVAAVLTSAVVWFVPNEPAAVTRGTTAR